MIEVTQAADVAEMLGLARRNAKRKRKGTPRCADCYFHKRMLCALDIDEACSTFRPDGPDGLVPPRQSTLLVRDT